VLDPEVEELVRDDVIRTLLNARIQVRNPMDVRVKLDGNEVVIELGGRVAFEVHRRMVAAGDHTSQHGGSPVLRIETANTHDALVALRRHVGGPITMLLGSQHR